MPEVTFDALCFSTGHKPGSVLHPQATIRAGGEQGLRRSSGRSSTTLPGLWFFHGVTV